MNIHARNHYLSEFMRVAETLPGADVPWLGRLRATAIDRFAQRGFPTRRDEEWKYTNLAALENHPFFAAAARPDRATARAIANSLALEDEAGHVLVFHNGHYMPSLSAAGKLPAGVQLCSLADALNAAPEALEPWLWDEEPQSAFGALNAAFMSDGAFLRLERGTVLEEPVHLLFISTGTDGMCHAKNIIVAEEGAAATVIEHHVGTDGALYFNNVVTRIFAAAGTAIVHHKLQQESREAFHVAGVHAFQQRDSRFESHSFSLGAALTRNDITTTFDAPGCEATLNGLYLADGNRHVDNHTRIDHRKPHCTSREHYRGVLDGTARAVFNGKIVVHPGAQKTSAFQANHNLLLSRDVEIDTKPELEIYADDVKCNHGATVGQLDEKQLFYLRSRGIDEAVARSLLVHAFAQELIERIRTGALRTRLEQLLLARLPQDQLIGELR